MFECIDNFNKILSNADFLFVDQLQVHPNLEIVQDTKTTIISEFFESITDSENAQENNILVSGEIY